MATKAIKMNFKELSKVVEIDKAKGQTPDYSVKRNISDLVTSTKAIPLDKSYFNTSLLDDPNSQFLIVSKISDSAKYDGEPKTTFVVMDVNFAQSFLEANTNLNVYDLENQENYIYYFVVDEFVAKKYEQFDVVKIRGDYHITFRLVKKFENYTPGGFQVVLTQSPLKVS